MARFIGERFTLRSTEISLNAILMKSLIHGVETRSKIKLMEIGCGAAEVAGKIQERIRGHDFHILPSFLLFQQLDTDTKLSERHTQQAAHSDRRRATRRSWLPVSQLRTAQNSKALVSCSAGTDVVTAWGPYPYAACNAASQPRV